MLARRSASNRRADQQLAQAGDRVAQYQLGHDGGHLDKDLAMLRRAAEGGFARAQASVGFRLKKSEEWAEAARWFRRSAEQGDPSGQTEFALRLFRGQGVAKDRVLAFRLMLEAARSGDMVAQYNVGVMYERGAGTAADATKARHWLQLAADKGDEDAREKLKSLSEASTDGAFATDKMMRAAKRSNVRAGPGTSYAKVGLLEVGERVRVIERTGDWFRLAPLPGQTGRFIYAPLLTDLRPDK